MPKKITHSQEQAEFYDTYPSLVPWPELLASYGLSILYKPREIFWKRSIDRLEIKRSEKVLDLGCGLGVTLARLRKTYKIKGAGIDVSKDSIDFAQDHFSSKNLSFKVSDAQSLPFSSSSFDVVVSFDALEHIEDQEKVLDEVVRVLKPNGRCLIYTMNENYQFTLDWVWEKLGFDIFKRAAHYKELFVDPHNIEQELVKRGMKVKKIKLFDSFFTLALDEMIMVSIIVLKKLNLDKNIQVGKVFLSTANIVSRVLFPVVTFLDLPWLLFGKSLSFCIVARYDEK